MAINHPLLDFDARRLAEFQTQAREATAIACGGHTVDHGAASSSGGLDPQHLNRPSRDATTDPPPFPLDGAGAVVCPHCGAPVVAVDTSDQQLHEAVATLQQDDPDLSYGDALRQVNRQREADAAAMVEAARSGLSAAQVTAQRQLNARAERVERDEGIPYVDALKKVLTDPMMRRFADMSRHG